MRVKARICWLTPEEGGRKRPPPGPVYSTVAKFNGASSNWKDQAWSIVVELYGPTDTSQCTTADVRFLSPHGPVELLYSGSQFELLEGHRKVAIGTIL
jgi:hypothetical protein